jgi:diamine N-acetyltransferase
MLPEIRLKEVTKEDIPRLIKWLEDKDISSSWFGRYTYGDPIHLGYHPAEMLKASQEEWFNVFNDPNKRIFSIYSALDEHIGEAKILIDETLGNAEIPILIGRKDLWHQGYGTATVLVLLDLAFNNYGLHRIWVDIPEYNEAAINMFSNLGFVHEGILRKSHPHEGKRFDSSIMGMLASEYSKQIGAISKQKMDMYLNTEHKKI